MNRKERRIAESQNKQSPNDLLGKAGALYQGGNVNEAETICKNLLAASPGNVLALNLLGAIYLKKGNAEEAIRFFKKAVAADPNYGEGYYNIAFVLYSQKRYDEALTFYDKASILNPNNATIHNSRAAIFQHLKRYGDALASADNAIAIDPHFAMAYNTRGVALRALEQHSNALINYDKAIALKPDYSEAYYNRANALSALCRYSEALECYDKAIAINPGSADTYWNKSHLKLLLGEYEEGWKLYEWRWKRSGTGYELPTFDKPLWLGKQSLEGKTISLRGEQGLGDTLQFCRYIPMVEALGATIIVEVPSSLVGLLSTLSTSPRVTVRDTHLPDFDFHCPLMSLPLAFGTKVETIPSEPYLSAQPEYVEKWRPLLDDKLSKEALRVGLCWAGGIRPDNPDALRIDAIRSLQFSQMKPLLDCQNIAFVSLQLGPPKDQLDDSRVVDISSELKDWSDTAAVISLLDLVITVDTSVCHLAGALGKKFWLLNRLETCWRWLLNREDSPWYPSARLFRQQESGDWAGVIMRVKEELSNFDPTQKILSNQ